MTALTETELLETLVAVESLAAAELLEGWMMSRLLKLPRARYLQFIQATERERAKRGV